MLVNGREGGREVVPLAGRGKTNNEVWSMGCGVAEVSDHNLG